MQVLIALCLGECFVVRMNAVYYSGRFSKALYPNYYSND
jgi:hypothetical protein